MHRASFGWVILCCFILGVCTRAGADETAPPTDDKSAAKSGDDKAKQEAGWISLFDGKTFDGWKINENKDTWKIENGELVTHGERSHLFYEGKVENHKFKNFELQLEIKTKPNANSGVYVHTKYQADGWPANGVEVQVNNTHSDRIKTASFYRAKNVMDQSPAKDDEWFTMNIKVKDKHATVKVNDKVVNDFEQPENWRREEGWEKNVFSDEGGTIALQGHDPESEVHYRNIRIRPLP